MKIQSNIPISESQKWLNEQFFVAFNHKDNGVQPEGEEGKRYEAEFIIVESLNDAELLRATHRHFHDAELEQQVIDNIEVDRGTAIKVNRTYDPNLPQIKSVGIITDSSLIKGSEVITSEILPVDEVIEKINGGVKNYVIDLSEGSRTTATDTIINQLIADGNVIITKQ